MKKPIHKHRKMSNKTLNYILIGIVALTVVLMVALAVANALNPDMDYVITADGHVHAADGTHVGEADEMFGSDYVVTEDGHVHAADGTHIGTYDATSEDAAEESAVEVTEDASEESTEDAAN